MKRFKRIRFILLLFVFILTIFIIFFRDGIILDTVGLHLESPFTKKIEVPLKHSQVDYNNNSIPDPLDVVNAARKEVAQRTFYKSTYYAGGYPPNSEGVCTDVIWRGLMGADIEIKELMDRDITENTKLYPRVNGKPDPNIDFRRVPNQFVYLKRYAESLTTEMIPGDIENLMEWQPGDIVVFLDGFHHVAIISDKRTKDGIPYVIHNNRPFAAEVKLSSFKTPIAGHYRWKYDVSNLH